MHGVFKRAAALLLTATLMNLSSPALLASPAPAVGEVVTAGALTIGGSPAVSGPRFFTPEGVNSFVNTPESSVQTDAGEPAVFAVKVSPEGTTVSVQSGRVE